ncbi:hypothetical protein [Klebsiella pneumoniae]|uniref:hypothetical protein n=1 Tax=Klebsiella pneumoniae TaxID=573 RepID=UPI000E2CD43E|nr:hypothetical protein [Klebsiella pneumoniae]SYM49941.1 Uncharacterised protein [Klebsiella pneumoniae]SYM80396.1 Uncharacterised protein [Klebsiella pneumoniae]
MTNNQLTDAQISNATLIRLIRWADEHNSHYVAAALRELQERRKAAIDSEPVKWINGCNKSVPAALRYLAENPRPIGGESSFNTAHLYQLAREIESMSSVSLYRHAQPAPVSDCKPVAWLAIYHGEIYDDAIGITRSVVEAQADRFGWESALTEIIPLYRHAQPAPEKYNIGDATMRHIFTPTGMTNVSDMQAVFDRVEAVFVGMEQPAPVVPDGYVMVPMRLTAENGAKGALSGEFSETKFVNCPECFGDDECETCNGSGRIEIKVPVSWTTIKEIWIKGVEHFAAAPQENN